MSVQSGVYSRPAGNDPECGLWFNAARGDTVVVCMFTPHASGKFYGGASQTLGGLINQFVLYGANPTQPGPSVKVGTVRVEFGSGGVVVRSIDGDTTQFAGSYPRV